MILEAEKVKLRAQRMEKLIALAEKLRQVRKFLYFSQLIIIRQIISSL
jgi:hypothetical protein